MGKVTKANCKWCGKSYDKTLTNAYCSDSCRWLAAKVRLQERYREHYTYVSQSKTGKSYQEYLDESTPAYNNFKPAENKPDPEAKRIKVPDLGFKVFTETKNMIPMGWKTDEERDKWRNR